MVFSCFVINSCVVSISYTLSIDLSDTSVHPSSSEMHKKHQRKSALKQGNHTQKEKGERRQEWHLMILHIVSVALNSAGQDGGSSRRRRIDRFCSSFSEQMIK